jgi:hypothetical protein
MIRPHMLAIGLVLLACGLYSRGSLRTRCLWAFAISFVFTWSYSNPHFIVLPALAFCVAIYSEFGRKSILLPLSSTAGFLAGLVIHPQFPNSLLMWKVQSFDAMLYSIILDNSPISKPSEFDKPSSFWFLMALPLLLLLYVELMSLIKMKERFGVRGIPPHIKGLALMTGFFSASALLAMRSVEYVAPLACLLGAALYVEMLNGSFSLGFSPKAISGTSARPPRSASSAERSPSSNTDASSASPGCPASERWPGWTASSSRAKWCVNINWGDFPMMLYSSHRYRYVWGMDPMFAYAKNKEAALALDGAVSIRESLAGPDRRETGARYGVIIDWRLAQKFIIGGWRMTQECADGYIFELKD